MLNILRKKEKKNEDKITVDPREEAIWIRENCTDKFSIEDIMEILDYEMNYLTHLGLTDLSEQEIEENLKYWAEHNG